MRAVAVDQFGDSLFIRDVSMPDLGSDDVLVRVRAAGVNPIDWKLAEGGKAGPQTRFPLALGQDAAGNVDRVGSNVNRFKVGDEVFGSFWFAGTYAEFVRESPSAAIARKPVAVDFEHAAALPIPARTALMTADAAAAKDGQKLLIVGATGGVGSYAVQIAAARGAYVIATARPDAGAYIKRLGASETIDHSKGDLVESVKQSHPKGVDALIDVVSKRDALSGIAELLQPGGRLVTTIHAADACQMAQRGIKATNVDVLGTTTALRRRSFRARDGDPVRAAIEAEKRGRPRKAARYANSKRRNCVRPKFLARRTPKIVCVPNFSA